MNSNFLFIENVTKEVEIPRNGILSRSLYSGDQVKVTIFGFDAGQELTKHTASSTAILHIVQGEAKLTLGDTSMDVSGGAWAQMAPHLEHAIYAKTPVIMVLYMMQ